MKTLYRTWNPFRVIKKNRGYFGFALSMFAIGLLVGWIFFDGLHEFLKAQLEHIQEIAKQANDSNLNLALLLFKNNLTVSIILLLSGALLSIFAIGGVVINGMVVGYALALMTKMGQVPVWALVAFGILPHGILEIPAFLLAGGMGIKLGYMWLRPMAGKTRLRSFGNACLESMMVLPVIIVFLVAAAGIEGFITPQLLGWYLR